jgi:hypothetical protein
MDEPEQPKFKTLLEKEREKRARPVTVQGVDKAWWKKELSYWRSCPHLDEITCTPSKKFREVPFICSGSWHQTCEIYLLLKNNNEDPTVLIHE